MTKYNFKNSDFSFSPTKNGIYENAKGGTELMYEGLMSRLPDHYKNKIQIICSRVRELELDKKYILYLHDCWDDPENTHLRDPESVKRFSKFIFVSYYQFTTYHLAYGIPHNKSYILKNAIVPIEKHEKPDDGVINLIYHTTPHRGLNILVPVFEHIASKLDSRVHLDVYSSFKLYGWPDRDKEYEPLFEACRKHPNITYHGAKPNNEIRKALKEAHIFAYPSIWPETSCIAAIEAMSAGCAVIAPDLAALSETLHGFGFQYRYNENMQEHANFFASILNDTIQKVRGNKLEKHLISMKNYVNMAHSWENRIPQWMAVLDEVLTNG